MIEVRMVEAADAPQIVALGAAAFEGDPLEEELMQLQSATNEQRAAYIEWRTERLQQRIQRPDGFWYKAIDKDSGEIVGCTGIYSPAIHKQNAPKFPSNDLPRKLAMPEIINASAMAEHGKELDNIKARLMADRKDFWYVQTMIVSPRHQRKGIGSMLLNAALSHVDEAGQDVYLEALPAAVKLCRAAGFEVLDTLVPLQRFDTVTKSLMLRRATRGT